MPRFPRSEAKPSGDIAKPPRSEAKPSGALHQAGIRRDAVERFFAAQVPGGAGPLRFSLISGGRSNITYRVDGPGGTWVLRRPPLGHVLPTAHDMAREYRVIAALGDTDVPVARAIALCEDTTVNDAPFYVMDFVEGVVLDTKLPPGFAETHAERGRIGDALVATLAKLHAVDYCALGLADFGRPEGYVERQVRVTPYPTEDVGWVTDQVGPHVLLFNTDYPHVEGGRRPFERFEKSLGDRSEDIRRKFYADNFVDLMGSAVASLV